MTHAVTWTCSELRELKRKERKESKQFPSLQSNVLMVDIFTFKMVTSTPIRGSEGGREGGKRKKYESIK